MSTTLRRRSINDASLVGSDTSALMVTEICCEIVANRLVCLISDSATGFSLRGVFMPTVLARRADRSGLHPLLRDKIRRIEEDLAAVDLPFRLFETYRSPERQAELFAKGRTAPGKIVTRAKPWNSFHQYGLAVDIVLHVNGEWSWSNEGAFATAWNELHSIGRKHGLVPLSWEKPHLQIAGIEIDQLRHGDYPAGGDDEWASNLREAVERWRVPGAPPYPKAASERPPLDDPGEEEEPEVFAVFAGPTAFPLREQPERGLTRQIIQAAQASQLQWGVPASVTLAQFVLESAGGRRMPPGSNNPFGIKARQGEPSIEAMTEEVVNGRRIRKTEKFRRFADFDEAFARHGRLLATSRYYTGAMAVRHDPVAFSRALTGIYATDPRYGDKLVELIETCDLRSYDIDRTISLPPLATSATPSPSTSAASQLGEHGPHVSALQQALVAAGYALGAVDGVFGPLTLGALQSFQADAGLAVTGTADIETLRRLNSAPPRPLSHARTGATEADLVAKGSVTMREARRTRLLGLWTGAIGALGIGNSAVVAGAGGAVPSAPPVAVEALLARLTAVLADPAARADPDQLQPLLRTAEDLLAALRSGATPQLGRLATELRAALPPGFATEQPDLDRLLTILASFGNTAEAGPRTLFDLLPRMFSDGTALQTVADGLAAIAASTVPGLGGSLVALGIGLAARHFGARIARTRLAEHRNGRNLGR